MRSRKKPSLPKPRIPLPPKPPKVERDERKETDRRRCRLPVRPDQEAEK
jgi:hypothetical protein